MPIQTTLGSLMQHFQAERDAHLRELGKANENGAVELQPLDENWAEFVRRMEALSNVPVYVEWKP